MRLWLGKGYTTEKKPRVIHVCTCLGCQGQPLSQTAKLHASINCVLATLDEKSRRRFVGLLAAQHGYGGVQHLACVTGLSRTTILRGRREIEQVESDSDRRIRALGGGGQFLEKNNPPCSIPWMS